MELLEKKKTRKFRIYRYVLAQGSAGLMKVRRIVHNKLCHKDKIQQYNERLNSKFPITSQCNSFDECIVATINPFWLAGFIAGDGSFQIKLISVQNRSRPEVRLMIQIGGQQDESPLNVPGA